MKLSKYIENQNDKLAFTRDNGTKKVNIDYVIVSNKKILKGIKRLERMGCK